MTEFDQLNAKIQRQREIIREMEAQPINEWVDPASRRESLFRAGMREVELIDLKCRLITEGLMPP